MRADTQMTGTRVGYNIVVVTLDQHAAGPATRILPQLTRDFPGLNISIHAAAEWAENPAALDRCKLSLETADIVIANLLFIEEHITAILPHLTAARARADAFVGVIADSAIVKLTKMGDLDMSKPASATMAMLKKLKPSAKTSANSGEKQMSMLRRLPKILRWIPGKSQDLRAWFLSMQYWLGGSDDNIEQMIRFLIGRYASRKDWRGTASKAPVDYPEVGLYHPSLAGRITTTLADLPRPAGARLTVGLLLLRSYVLASDTAHYDAVIAAFEARGIACIPAFAGGLDGRPAINAYFKTVGRHVDSMVSLSGFSLVGGPAYNDSPAAVEALSALDVPYIAAHPLEFQTLGQWAKADMGLGPIETTMLIALPEIDGATNPTVFAGRHGLEGCSGCAHKCQGSADSRAMSPCHERIASLTEKTERLANLRQLKNVDKKVGIVLFGFPPNAGAAGTAAYLSVFESLHNTLTAMKTAGYTLDVPATVADLREAVLGGNSVSYGQPANIEAFVTADHIVAHTPNLDVLEQVWGPAPGKVQADGRHVFVLGKKFGNIFVGLQPTFGYEGDPMRLLFERSFAPTHAFVQFYLWMRNTWGADAYLHFGMHGALEFMPGKQAGLGAGDWPDRLIGEVPNIYLYAANNPSEASLAKRRSNAVTISHLTPPLAAAGLYKGLIELKDSLTRWRLMPKDAPERADLETLIAEQATAVDMAGQKPAALWLKLLEAESALIPDGLHVVGRPMSADARADYLDLLPAMDAVTRARIDLQLQQDTEIPAILRALSARFIAPVPGGDLIRSPQILPTGR
ncbi:MAG: magnesium chelatase subunit H, partial [Cypionkella sp.]